MFYPVCTDGDYSCLWHQFYDKGLSPAQIVANALQKVLVKSKCGDLSGVVLVNIASLYDSKPAIIISLLAAAVVSNHQTAAVAECRRKKRGADNTPKRGADNTSKWLCGHARPGQTATGTVGIVCEMRRRTRGTVYVPQMHKVLL